MIIYLGDGCPTCPGDAGPGTISRILEQVAAQNYKRHGINAIVVGSVCPEFPTTLSLQNGGTFTNLGDTLRASNGCP